MKRKLLFVLLLAAQMPVSYALAGSGKGVGGGHIRVSGPAADTARPAHKGFSTEVLEGLSSVSKSWMLSAVGWSISKLPSIEDKIKAMIDGVYQSWAKPTLYYSDAYPELGKPAFYNLSTTLPNTEIQRLVEFMEASKVSSELQSAVDMRSAQEGRFVESFEDLAREYRIDLQPFKEAIVDTGIEPVLSRRFLSLFNIFNTVIEGGYEDQLFFAAFSGERKYQFFSFGLHQGRLHISYVIDHKAPTPVLNFELPLEGLDLVKLSHGLHYLMNDLASSKDRHRVPRLENVWMITGANVSGSQ